MLVVLVEFDLNEGTVDAFMPLMRKQARTSLDAEPGCHRFDICSAPEDPSRVLLYELYDDRQAFDTHLASAHFRSFDAEVAPMVAAKSVRFLTLEAP